MRIALILTFVLAWCVSCAPDRETLIPENIQGDCSADCANAAKLGGCGLDMSSCVADCRATQAAEAEVGLTYPVGCLSAAASCEARRACATPGRVGSCPDRRRCL